MNKKEIVAFAFATPIADFDKYVRAIAQLRATPKGCLEDEAHESMAKAPERLAQHVYAYCVECRSTAREVDSQRPSREELRIWLPRARQDAGAVRDAGLSWTLANAELAFHGKLPGQRRFTCVQCKRVHVETAWHIDTATDYVCEACSDEQIAKCNRRSA